VGTPPSEGPGRGNSPIFIVCGARTGSTLLRWLVDAHPDIACPAETDLVELLQAELHTARALGSPDPLEHARANVDSLMAAYLHRNAISRWCDKSLSNVDHLELLASAWPEARFLLLHRHCMDFVLSGLEAQPWGLSDYGFSEFAAKAPGDDITALAAYWIDRSTKMLRFEERSPGRCLRIRYEDLVSKTDDVVSGVWAFLGAAPLVDGVPEAFSGRHDGVGPADYKVWYTTRVHQDSVGHGARVPPDRIRGPVRRSVNELLDELGYPDRVDAGWGSGGLVALDGSSVVRPGVPEVPGGHGRGAVELRVVDGDQVLWRGGIDRSGAADGRWAMTDPDHRRPTTSIVTVEPQVLDPLVAGSQNLGDALRRRTVRYYGPPLADFGHEQAFFRGLVPFVAGHGLSDQLDVVNSAARTAVRQ
jgi:protein-tyrosine sulfotransferase